MPYRIDIPRIVPRGDPSAASEALDRLIALGAIDVEQSDEGGLAALMPDGVAPEEIATALGVGDLSVSPAMGRDDGSVWVLRPRPFHAGHFRIVPADTEGGPGVMKLIDTAVFGTGLHPTTALCLEALEEIVQFSPPDAVLDVGTGSGVLAIAALMMGVPRALGIDVDGEALRVAAENARVNGVEGRLELRPGGPETVTGMWPLVLANVVAAPLIEMAPALVQRVSHQGRLVLSGIPVSVEPDVDRAYRRLGMRRVGVTSRGGWIALVMQASW